MWESTKRGIGPSGRAEICRSAQSLGTTGSPWGEGERRGRKGTIGRVEARQSVRSRTAYLSGNKTPFPAYIRGIDGVAVAAAEGHVEGDGGGGVGGVEVVRSGDPTHDQRIGPRDAVRVDDIRLRGWIRDFEAGAIACCLGGEHGTCCWESDVCGLYAHKLGLPHTASRVLEGGE